MTQEETLCRQVRERLEAFHDGEVSPLEALGIERHLETCASCQEEVQNAEEISSWIRNEGRQVSGPPSWSSLERRIATRVERKPFRPGRLALLAASLAMVVATLSWLFAPSSADRELAVSVERVGSVDSPVQMAGLGLPGLDQFLAEHKAVEIDPPDLGSQSLPFRPHLPEHLPGGFQLEKAFRIEDRCCSGVCFLFKGPANRRIGLIQQGPSHPLVWKGARLDEKQIGRTPCRRIRIDHIELTQIDPDGRNVTLVVASDFEASDELVRFLADR